MTIKNDLKKPFYHMRPEVLISLFLIISTFTVYWQVRNFEFLANYDDLESVVENAIVQKGLTREGIAWAFTTFHTGNWHPLTWLSHMLDIQLYGLDAGQHHLINVLFHIANSLWLFFIFRRMTADLWPSAFVAAMFALHPLHVESVAMVAERKDVLSTFFWMLTLWSYVRYTQHPGFYRYLLALVFFGLGLMAKPMLVTLPFVLLLLDYWPLKRLRFESFISAEQSRKGAKAFFLILEKIPFLFFSAATSVVTLLAMQSVGGIVSRDLFPLKERIANAVISYCSYLAKTIIPHSLAAYYPYRHSISTWQVTAAGVLLVSLTALTIISARRRPYLTVGWLWYLGTLFPVIGLVQMASHAMADHYTYVPLVGVFILMAWGIPELLKNWQFKRIGLAAATAVFLTILMGITWIQTGYWSNGITLFRHAIEVTTGNWAAHNNLGVALRSQGRLREATTHYREAVRISPNYTDAHVNLAIALGQQGNLSEAILQFNEALRLNPRHTVAHNNLGVALALRGNLKEAIVHFREAIRLQPDYTDARNNLKKVLKSQSEQP